MFFVGKRIGKKMLIEDGEGNGRIAGVNKKNRLKTTTIRFTGEHYTNHADGQTYALNFDATPTGAGDCFLYIKNTDDSEDLIIKGFGLKLVANEYIDVKIGDTGTAVGGGAIVPVNLNSSSGLSASGTFEDGVDITGLSGGSIAYRIYHASSNGTTYYTFKQDIILKKNGIFTLYCQTGTTALAGYIDMNYHSHDKDSAYAG